MKLMFYLIASSRILFTICLTHRERESPDLTDMYITLTQTFSSVGDAGNGVLEGIESNIIQHVKLYNPLSGIPRSVHGSSNICSFPK